MQSTRITPIAALDRTTFTTSRLLEFFTEKELQMQIGYPRVLWPLALVKELCDNGLDACENAGIVPEITISIEPNAVTVADNGPGLPRDTLRRSLDYLTRTSDKSYYVSPTRGQLGNALKCVLAAPFVADGSHGSIEVTTSGRRSVIDVTLDRIAQTPRIDLHETVAANGIIGTAVRMDWSGVASLLTEHDRPDSYNVAQLARAFALFNPHLTITVVTPDGSQHWERSGATWRKWSPKQPTDPHWYTPERLAGLIAAYLTTDGEGKTRTVREFVSEFAGLAGTAKQKAVTEAAGLTGATLRSLAGGGELDQHQIARLLTAMQESARVVKPAALGTVGPGHLTACLVTMFHAAPETIRYSKQEGAEGSVPFVIETAFGVHDRATQDRGRDLAVGVNWAAMLQSPLTQLTDLLGEVRLDAHDPVCLLVHLASPRIEFSDHGKTMIGSASMTTMGTALDKSIRSVTKAWTEAKRSEDRAHRISSRNLARLRLRTPERSIKEAAYEVMEAAYLHASAGGTLWANARQIMYAARPRVLEITEGKGWKDSAYFTQTLLPNFIDEHPALTTGWRVAYDARGHFGEPHTRSRTSLGTVEVRRYFESWRSKPADHLAIHLSHGWPTHGPAGRYRFALFIEKEGFTPLLEEAQIGDRFDLAIMSTKGMSVTAARELVDRLSDAGVTILVLHDFDKAGFSIFDTLRRSGRRYTFNGRPNVVDLGLHLRDVEALDLDSEPVEYEGRVDPRINLGACGATQDECAFLVQARGWGWSGQRVELNAMTSDQFIAWLEGKLRAAGVEKVIPDTGVLADAYRRARRTARVQALIDALETEARAEDPDTITVPDDLTEQVRRRIAGSAKSWDESVWELARESGDEREAAPASALSACFSQSSAPAPAHMRDTDGEGASDASDA